MKRILILLTGILAMSTAMQAAPGDTTTVQAYSALWMDHYGSFDTTLEFPDNTKTYRKINMTFKLGKRPCPGYNPNNAGEGPGQTGWCGDWDYDVHLFIMTKSGDTLEMGRFITPYARENAPRTPMSWTQRYVFDVTDFYNQLRDSATFRIFYSGYSWGFTGDVKFDFIEGTPPRNVLGVDRLWKGGYTFGATSPIDDNVIGITKTAPANAQFTEMKFNITGHGADNTGCAEFCKKYYTVLLNKALGPQTEIWRGDCGSNHLYPQSGTWVYDRGNWCPGDKVITNIHKLAVTGGSTYEIDVDFQGYTGSGNLGSYKIEAAAFYYGAYNKTTDASLDDIIAPSNHETHFRYNPATGRPLVTVTNTGSATITSIKFKYEMAGGTGPVEYTWQGSLASLNSTNIEFEPFYDFRKAVGSGNIFNVEIVAVNGVADEDATNNKMSSTFNATLKVPTTMLVELTTNASTVSGISESSWKIVDLFNGIIAAERKNCAPNTSYTDTVRLTVGMYKLVVEDAGCDGLSWWANNAAGAGSLRFLRTGTPFPENLTGYFGGDFGCGFTQYFNVDWPAGITGIENATPAIVAHPNPAQTTVSVKLYGVENANGILQLKDMTGKIVVEQKATDMVNTIDVSGIANGIYIIEYTGDAMKGKLQGKVIVAR